MARILSDNFVVPNDTSPVYSEWGEVGTATSVDAAVTVSNDMSADLWIQWTDDPNGPEPEDVDVFAVGDDPNGDHYYVYANGLAPAGDYIRIKGVADGFTATCHATVDTN